MANEITLNVSATLNNGNLKRSFAPGQKLVTQTTKGAWAAVVSVGTSTETLSFGDVATEGYIMLVNLDPTNFVLYGPDSTGQIDFGKLFPGEIALFRLKPGITFKWKADTGACKVAVELWEH